jgi:hypothetical protein
VASGEWRVASGEWRVASGEWRVASGEWRVASGDQVLKNQVSREGAETRRLFEYFMVKFVGESPCSALWRLFMTAGVPARYTPDSANSA